jgi:deazaflavin-dependent oxidoreductase (nitroreductase family)
VTPLRRALNGLVRTMLQLGIAPGDVYLLTVRGRRSGRPYSTPVNLIQNGERWLVAPYGEVGWVRNARAAGDVVLTRRGRSQSVAVEEVGPDEAAPVLRRYLEQVSVVRPYFDAAHDGPIEALVAEAPRHPVFRLREYRHEKEGSEDS